MKKHRINRFILLILMLFPIVVQAQMKDGKIRRVVLDAGHGGKDPGAIGSASREKDIALAVALKAGKYIRDNFPDVEVIYTRKTDEFIELDRRAKIANEAHADLFISIHCNSSKSKNPYGTETFVMGINKSAANLEVAKLENSAILLEDNFSSRYEGYDPRSPESNIIFSLYQDSYREYSLKLASSVQEQFRVRTARYDRGVKEAGFLVLYRTAMPSVLVETGFISNPAEEKYLRSDAGQVEIAATIYRAFGQYKSFVEKNNAGLHAPVAETKAPDDTPDKTVAQTENDSQDSSYNTQQKTSPEPGDSNPATEKQEEGPGQEWLVPDLVFRVQVLASPTKLEKNDPRVKGLTDLYEYQHAGMYKYTSGRFDTREKAEKFRSKLKAGGHPDAFIVAIYQDRRISDEQARVLTEAAMKTRNN